MTPDEAARMTASGLSLEGYAGYFTAAEGLTALVAFGSRGRGEARADSDLDQAVICAKARLTPEAEAQGSSTWGLRERSAARRTRERSKLIRAPQPSLRARCRASISRQP